tara:strand:+ start:395 stop:718 length:324 start_codon:yes stop_codon:yes gene_type:complete
MGKNALGIKQIKMGYKMKGMSFGNSPLKKEKPKKTHSTKEDDPNRSKEGDHTQYKHPTYYNNDGSINKGGSTGDFDEGELSRVMKDQNGRRYVERSDGKILFLDKPE